MTKKITGQTTDVAERIRNAVYYGEYGIVMISHNPALCRFSLLFKAAPSESGPPSYAEGIYVYVSQSGVLSLRGEGVRHNVAVKENHRTLTINDRTESISRIYAVIEELFLAHDLTQFEDIVIKDVYPDLTAALTAKVKPQEKIMEPNNTITLSRGLMAEVRHAADTHFGTMWVRFSRDKKYLELRFMRKEGGARTVYASAKTERPLFYEATTFDRVLIAPDIWPEFMDFIPMSSRFEFPGLRILVTASLRTWVTVNVNAVNKRLALWDKPNTPAESPSLKPKQRISFAPAFFKRINQACLTHGNKLEIRFDRKLRDLQLCLGSDGTDGTWVRFDAVICDNFEACESMPNGRSAEVLDPARFYRLNVEGNRDPALVVLAHLNEAFETLQPFGSNDQAQIENKELRKNIAEQSVTIVCQNQTLRRLGKANAALDGQVNQLQRTLTVTKDKLSMEEAKNYNLRENLRLVTDKGETKRNFLEDLSNANRSLKNELELQVKATAARSEAAANYLDTLLKLDQKHQSLIHQHDKLVAQFAEIQKFCNKGLANNG